MTDSQNNSTDEPDTEQAWKEEELDDNDYTPTFVVKLLDNPDLLPRDIRGDFDRVFCDFEYSHNGRAKTTIEFMLVTEITKLTLSLIRLDRMESLIVDNQRRPAVESLFRRTHEGAAMQGAEAGLRSAAIESGKEYFVDPVFKAKADAAFNAAGYSPDALDAEAYLRALPSLAVMHRQRAANRKALFTLLKDLETRFQSRHPEKQMLVKKPAKKSGGSDPSDGSVS